MQTIAHFLISLSIFILLSAEARSANDIGDISFKVENCMLHINSLPEYTTLPKLNKSQISEWGKNNKSDVVLPEHDFIYVSRDDVLKHIATTYYFDSKSRQGYVRLKSGIADNTDWYGSFYLNDEVVSCIKSIKEETK